MFQEPVMASNSISCTICGKASRYVCGQCKDDPYCNSDCQRNAWIEGHSVFCVGNPPARGQKQKPVNVGDFFDLKGGFFVLEVVRVDDLPGDEMRITTANISADTSDIERMFPRKVFYEDGAWNGDFFQMGVTLPLRHVRYSKNPWWKRVAMAPLTKGIVPLGSVHTLDGMTPPKIADVLRTMRPGDHYEWLGFHFKFFDFALEDHRWHKGYLASLSRGVLADLCKEIAPSHYFKSLAKVRHMMTISIIGTDYMEKGTAESFVGFLMSEPRVDNSVYYSTLCAQNLDVYDDMIAFVMQRTPVSTFRPSFGVMLQAMMGLYHRSEGRNSITLEATKTSASYYERFGYTKVSESGMTYKMDFDSVLIDDMWLRSRRVLGRLRDFVASVPADASYSRRIALY